MTPLANRIFKALCGNRKLLNDRSGMIDWFWDFHCFECTDVLETAIILGHKMYDEYEGGYARIRSDGVLSFLPAPRTWIEYEVQPSSQISDEPPIAPGTRMGFLIVEQEVDKGVRAALARLGPRVALAQVFFAGYTPGRTINMDGTTLLTLGLGEHAAVADDNSTTAVEDQAFIQAMLHGALAMINSPRVVGRKQHMPRRSQESRARAARKTLGHFPLHAWTEIVLEVTPPKIEEGDPVEAHLTGKKALHFVRQHLRIRNGRLERVRAHFRGDASVGIKRSRYRVTQ